MLLKVEYKIPYNPHIRTEETLEYLRDGLAHKMAEQIIKQFEFRFSGNNFERVATGKVMVLTESKFDSVLEKLDLIDRMTICEISSSLVSEIRRALIEE